MLWNIGKAMVDLRRWLVTAEPFGADGLGMDSEKIDRTQTYVNVKKLRFCGGFTYSV